MGAQSGEMCVGDPVWKPRKSYKRKLWAAELWAADSVEVERVLE